MGEGTGYGDTNMNARGLRRYRALPSLLLPQYHTRLMGGKR
jgi:hypothetical protein